MSDRYQGKRFALAILCVIALLVAFFGAGESSDGVNKFGSIALYIAGIFGAYCTGQSITDHAKIKNGGQSNAAQSP